MHLPKCCLGKTCPPPTRQSLRLLRLRRELPMPTPYCIYQRVRRETNVFAVDRKIQGWGTPFGSSSGTGTTGRKAREALWEAMCFNIFVADCRGVSQILFMLIAYPQSLQVVSVPPAVFLVVMYMS